MSKNMFAAINFNLAGKVLLVVGFLFIIINAISYIFNQEQVNYSLFIIGLALIAVSLYLIKFGPKD